MPEIDIDWDIPVSDDETKPSYVTVTYETIKAQPDVGIMRDYPEITNVELPDEYQSNRFAQAELELLLTDSSKEGESLHNKLNDGVI